MKNYYQFNIVVHLLIALVLFLISKAMFEIQVIAGVIFLIAGLYYVIMSFLVVVKISIYDDCIVSHKLLTKKKIPLNNIKNVTVEKRHFMGEGRLSERQAVVVSYVEEAGYGDEIFFNYNASMYSDLKKVL